MRFRIKSGKIQLLIYMPAAVNRPFSLHYFTHISASLPSIAQLLYSGVYQTLKNAAYSKPGQRRKDFECTSLSTQPSPVRRHVYLDHTRGTLWKTTTATTP